MEYDYLVVGAGLYGAVFAEQAIKKGKKVLVIDKRPNIAGNIYTEKIEGINVHKYGAHIFHTNNKDVWEYINQFAEFNRYTNSPIANYNGEIFSLPFNMYTFSKLWNITTPDEYMSNALLWTEKNQRILRSKQLVLSEKIFMRSLSKDTPKSNGEDPVQSYQLLLLNACL